MRKKEYNERVLNVEKGNFTPLVFLTSGGMSKECKRFINILNKTNLNFIVYVSSQSINRVNYVSII